ncbi:hypothetical protein D3C81_1289780 [compost metagenome]
MNHAPALKELERAIDGRRLGRLAVKAVAGDQVIGLDRLAGRQQQLQHPAARGGHALALGGAAGLDRVDRLRNLGGAGSAVGMIVIASNAHAPQLRGPEPHRNQGRRRSPAPGTAFVEPTRLRRVRP